MIVAVDGQPTPQFGDISDRIRGSSGEPITLKYAGDIAYLTAAFLRQAEPFRLHPSLEETPWFL